MDENIQPGDFIENKSFTPKSPVTFESLHNLVNGPVYSQKGFDPLQTHRL